MNRIVATFADCLAGGYSYRITFENEINPVTTPAIGRQLNWFCRFTHVEQNVITGICLTS